MNRLKLVYEWDEDYTKPAALREAADGDLVRWEDTEHLRAELLAAQQTVATLTREKVEQVERCDRHQACTLERVRLLELDRARLLEQLKNLAESYAVATKVNIDRTRELNAARRMLLAARDEIREWEQADAAQQGSARGCLQELARRLDAVDRAPTPPPAAEPVTEQERAVVKYALAWLQSDNPIDLGKNEGMMVLALRAYEADIARRAAAREGKP